MRDWNKEGETRTERRKRKGAAFMRNARSSVQLGEAVSMSGIRGRGMGGWNRLVENLSALVCGSIGVWLPHRTPHCPGVQLMVSSDEGR